MRKSLQLVFPAVLALIAAGQVVMASPAAAAYDPLPQVTTPVPFGCTDQTVAVTICTNDNKGPNTTDSSDRIVVDDLIRLIGRTTGGDTLRVSMFQWWYGKTTTSPPFDRVRLQALTNAIIDAYSQRGVDVQIIIDNISDPNFNFGLQTGYTQPFVELQQAFPSNRFHICHQDGDPLKDTDPAQTFGSDCLDRSNLDVGETHKRNAINHNKLFLVEIAGVKHVVLTSANLVPDAQRAYNNLVHVRWDNALYNYMLGYWNRIKDNSWGGWGSPRSSIGDTAARTAYLSPNTVPWDHFVNVLDRVSSCPNSSDRKIWISMSGITQVRLQQNSNRLKNRLGSLVQMGCAVKVVADDHMADHGTQDEQNEIDGETRQLLTSVGVEVVQTETLHHKYMIVDAVVDGAGREDFWSGAQNLSYAAAWRDGEAVVHQTGPTGQTGPVPLRAYVSNFSCMWNRNHQLSLDPGVLGGNNDDPYGGDAC